MLFGEKSDNDVDEAQILAPDDISVLLRCAHHYFFTNRTSLAVPIFHKCRLMGAASDCNFLLAMALRSIDPSGNQDEWLRLATEAATDLSGTQQLDALSLTISTLCATAQFEKCEVLIATPGLQFEVVECLKASLSIARKQFADAARQANAAADGLTDASSTEVIRFVGETLLRVGAISKALPMLEKVALASKQINDAWDTVNAARKLQDFACIRRICRQWREAGVLDPLLIDIEVAVLERFAPLEAIDLVKQLVEKMPDDDILHLRLGRLAVEFDKPELIWRDIATLPNARTASVEVGAEVVQYLIAIDEHAAAVEYAYELLRHNQTDPIALQAIAFAVIPTNPPEEVINKPIVVGPGIAFCLKEEGSGSERWYVIKSDDSEPSFPDEIAPTHGLAKKVLGRSLGDNLLLSGESVGGRYAVLKELKSKYVYRAQRVLEEWELTFPDIHFVESVRLGEPKGELEMPDFTPLILKAHEQQRTIEHFLALYREYPVTIHMLASSLAKSDFETLCFLARNENGGIRCADGEMNSLRTAVDAIDAGAVIVLDLSAIATLDLLDLCETVLCSPFRFTITTNTLQEIRRLRDSERDRLNHSGYMSASNTGLGVQFVEVPKDRIEEGIRKVEAILDVLTKHVECVDAGELIEVTPSTREMALRVLGLHGAEIAVFASRPGHVLFTDDLAAAIWTKHNFGNDRVWIQPLLAALGASGHISWLSITMRRQG